MSRIRLQPKQFRVTACVPCKHIPAQLSVTEVFTIDGQACIGQVCKRCFMPYFKPVTAEEQIRAKLVQGVA